MTADLCSFFAYIVDVDALDGTPGDAPGRFALSCGMCGFHEPIADQEELSAVMRVGPQYHYKPTS